MHTDEAKPKPLQSFAGNDGKRRGRRPSKVTGDAPFDLAADDKLMASLDPRGWRRELGTRQRRAFIVEHYGKESLERTSDDPQEMDRLMCRDQPVAKVETPEDLNVARFNSRLVLEVDLDCLDDVLFQKIKEFLKVAREEKRKPSRHISFEAWSSHRILTLYDLQLNGYLRRGRKQLAKWLFPEIADPKARGDKYDRARELLSEALAALPTLRAWG